jgi:hypothetical protein
MKYCTLGILLILLLGAPAQGAVIKELNLEQLCTQAATIFSGVCIERSTDGSSALSYTFRVLQMIKGQPSDTITIRTHKTAAAVARAPVYTVGDEVILLLYPESSQGFTAPVGLGQGGFLVSRGADGEKVAANGRNNLNLFKGMDSRRYAKTAPGLANKSLLTSFSGPLVYADFIELLKAIVQSPAGTAAQ